MVICQRTSFGISHAALGSASILFAISFFPFYISYNGRDHIQMFPVLFPASFFLPSERCHLFVIQREISIKHFITKFIGKDPIVSYLIKATWQYMHHKPVYKFHCIELHHFCLSILSVVFPYEENFIIYNVHYPGI